MIEHFCLIKTQKAFDSQVIPSGPNYEDPLSIITEVTSI